MKHLSIVLTLVVALSYSNLSAQSNTGSLKGTITDTLNKQNLSNAVVSVLRAKDSVLLKYTRSTNTGSFELKGLPAGEFILLITYPSYADYVDKMSLAANQQKNLGQLPLITKARLLEEVIVKQRVSAIRVKGDTTEYRADSFRVGPNADVQELLRKMPGIQVNSKGEITTQGERVNKVLVDGEEFFSDDPAVVTKNLRADAIDKVQVYDRKSDQATFTGIDDGQKNKTINLLMKEDKKKGYFGKVEAGSDFDQYRNGKGLVNVFKGKRKIAAYVTTDNTKFESLNWEESRNYGGDGDITTSINDDGGMMMMISGDEFNYGQGFPNSTTGGLHFSNKWNKDKHNSNNTYQYNQLGVTSKIQNTTQNLLPGNSFISKTEQDKASDRKRHKLSSVYEWQLDSTSSIKMTVRASGIKTINNTRFLGQSISENGNLLNQSDRTTSNVDENNTLNSNIIWRKKFAKKGRTISWNTDLSLNDREDNGFLFAKNDFYDAAGNPVRQDNLDQMKVNKQNTSSISSLVSYTEPIWKNTFLVLNYTLNMNRNDAERNTFGKSGNGKYENAVDTLSNHFIFNTMGHTGSFNLRYNVKKFNFAIGSGIGTATYRLNDVRKNTDRDVTFNRFLPAVTFNFTPKQQRRINFNYRGTTQNPSLLQIQPIIDNIDPLNITVGNPDLKQSFTHNLSFGASDYKVLKSRNISFRGNFSTTNNAISNATTVDNLGRRTNQSINVNGNYNYNFSANYGFDLFPSFNVGMGLGPSKSRNINMINGLTNTTERSGMDLRFNAGYWSDKWINFWLNFNARNTKSTSSIRPDVVTQYWAYDTYSNVQFKFKKQKLFIDMTLEAQFFQKTPVFNNPNQLLLSSSVRKVLSKNDHWEAKLYVNDIFNKNRGISRSASSNFISETINQTIQRYFLVSLIYNFSKNGKPSAGF